MIVVRIEIWPGGDEKRKRLLGLGTIENISGASTAAHGSYVAKLLGATRAGVTPAVACRPPFRTVEIAGFPRKRLCAWDLLYRVLRAAVGTRNDID